MARNTHQNAAAISNANQGANTNSTMQIQNQLQIDLAQNPYFLHPNENLNQVLVSPIFIGFNYHGWATSMKRALVSKNKFKFVNGAISKPEEFDPMYDAWERCNNMVHNWLIHSISPGIARSVDALELASDVWKDLKECFSRGDMVKIAELMQEFHCCKQGTMFVTEYHTELKAYWEELENYRLIPSCVCPIKCTCEAMRSTRVSKQQEFVLQFLNGLGEQFSQIKLQILQTEPFPSMNQVFSKILQQDKQVSGSYQNESKIVINAAVAGNRNYGRGRGANSNKICTHYGKTGHTVDVCYKKHGFPPHFKFKNSTSANSALTDPVEDARYEDASLDSQKEEGIQPPGLVLTQDQYRSLMAFLGFRTGVKGFVLVDLATREVLISRHVKFYEHYLPYGSTNHHCNTFPGSNPDCDEYLSCSATDTASQSVSTPSCMHLAQLTPDTAPPISPPSSTYPAQIAPLVQSFRRSTRLRIPPTYLPDYHFNAATVSALNQSTSTVAYPLSQVLSHSGLSPSYQSYSLNILTESEHSSYAEANKFDCWHEAMQAEIRALEENQT